MALSYKARKRWALVVLALGVPSYIIAVVTFMNWLYPDPMMRPSIAVELLIYVLFGLLWAFPFRRLFRGIGQPDPEQGDQS